MVALADSGICADLYSVNASDPKQHVCALSRRKLDRSGRNFLPQATAKRFGARDFNRNGLQ
jgi:hypothetical protein